MKMIFPEPNWFSHFVSDFFSISPGHEVVGFMIHKRKIEEILISQTIPLLFPCALFRVSPPFSQPAKNRTVAFVIHFSSTEYANSILFRLVHLIVNNPSNSNSLSLVYLILYISLWAKTQKKNCVNNLKDKKLTFFSQKMLLILALEANGIQNYPRKLKNSGITLVQCAYIAILLQLHI